MSKIRPKFPVFIGGSLDEHILYMLCLCRLEHFSVPLASIHYLTWSVVHISVSLIAQSLVGALATIEFISSIVAWAILLDIRIGAFYGGLVFAYSAIAWFILSNYLTLVSPPIIVIGSLICLVLAIVVEASCHLVFQGILPGPLSEKIMKTPSYQRPLIAGYFVILFGLFFLSFDLCMRFFGYKQELHATVNSITNSWHKILADEAEKEKLLSVRDFHLYVIKQQQ